MHAMCSDAKQARVGVNQPLFMFVFRVLLSRAYICQEPKQFKRPPCTDASCCSDICSKHSLYDSVIGTHNFAGSSPTVMGLHLPLMKVLIKVTSLHNILQQFHMIFSITVKNYNFYAHKI